MRELWRTAPGDVGVMEEPVLGRTVEAALLEQYSASIDAMLSSPKLSSSNRMILETQRLFVMFMKAYQEDRGKVNVMWRTFRFGYRLLWLLIPLLVADVFVRVWSLLYPK
jgi:hypothetical protein